MAKKVLISGGSSGIGQGTAILMANYGWEVAITYHSHPDGAELTRKTIEENGGKCVILEAHLENEGAPEKMVREARDALGGLDAFVSNAGRDSRNSILTTTRAQMQAMVDTNFLGYLLAAGEAARIMVRDGTPGSIVFITSTRAVSAHPEDFLYGGLKASIERASKSMAMDLAPYQIRVNCVAPGATNVRPGRNQDVEPGTLINGKPYYPLKDVIPLKRMGLPEDVANAVEFLCNDRSTYITGTVVRVDGGLILPGMPEGYATCNWVTPGWTERHRKEMDEM